MVTEQPRGHLGASSDPGLIRFNSLADPSGDLAACCASAAWLGQVCAGRPYPDRAALLARSVAVLAGMRWDDIREAVDAHPRIGERVAAVARAPGGREAAWSRREQSALEGSSAQVRAALVEANRAYEDRFGHVFLIFATGRSDTEMLAAARARLDNDEATERAVVRGELSRIVALRLTRLLDPRAESGSAG